MKDNIYNKVEIALDEIRPFLHADGGDIELLSIVGDTVNVSLKGACTNCSFNQMTFISGVETTIKKHVPEINKVVNNQTLE